MKSSAARGIYRAKNFRFFPLLTLDFFRLLTLDFSYLDLRKDKNARNAVFYLGDISMVINGTSYISWRNWGEYLS